MARGTVWGLLYISLSNINAIHHCSGSSGCYEVDDPFYSEWPYHLNKISSSPEQTPISTDPSVSPSFRKYDKLIQYKNNVKAE